MSQGVSGGGGITLEQRVRERTVLFAILADLGMVMMYALIGIIGGSLTIIAESIRGGLALLLEGFALAVMRRIHRGGLAHLDYGSGKLEQIANIGIALSMILAAGWVAGSALAAIAGQHEVGTPFGLALAASIGAVNIYLNLVAWDGVRRAAAGDDSLLMEAQVALRVVKLVSSLVVEIALTVAALSPDPVIVTWADALGALFVSVYIVLGGMRIVREALPDLLDRAASEEVRTRIDWCLAQHRREYARVDAVRTRRSGQTLFVEIGLAFAGDLTMVEVERRIASLRATLNRHLSNADLSILSFLATPAGPGESR